MLVPWFVAILIGIGIAMVAFVILWLISKPLKIIPIAYRLTACVILIVVPMGLAFDYWTDTAYLVDGATSYRSFLLIGKLDYKFENGKTGEVETKRGYSLINDTDQPLEIGPVVYGQTPLGIRDDEIIPPYSVYYSRGKGIDYLFENPPQSVKSEHGIAVKTWLRRLADGNE